MYVSVTSTQESKLKYARNWGFLGIVSRHSVCIFVSASTFLLLFIAIIYCYLFILIHSFLFIYHIYHIYQFTNSFIYLSVHLSVCLSIYHSRTSRV